MPMKNRRSRAQKEVQKRRREQREGRRLCGEASDETPNETPGGSGEISLRASFSQSEPSQGLTNSLMFLVHLHETDEMAQKNLDHVLRSGDRLYCQIRRRLGASETFVSRHVSFDDVPDRLVTDRGCYVVVRASPVNGPLLQSAPEGWETNPNLSLRLQALGTAYSQALLTVGSLCLSVFQDRLGRYGFFDPHSRNADGSCAEENGKAVMVTFQAVTDLSDRLLRLFTGSLHFHEDQEYNLLPLCFERMTPLGAVQCGPDTPFAARAVLKLDKTRRTRTLRRLQALQKKQQASNGKRDVTGSEKKKKEKKEDSDRERYRMGSAQKQAEIRSRYWNNPDFRMRQQVYMRNRYRQDPSFNQRQKEYMRNRYRNDSLFKQRQKQKSRTRYLNEKLKRHMGDEDAVFYHAEHKHSVTPSAEPMYSLCMQNLHQGPEHVCSICHRSMCPSQARTSGSPEDAPLASTSLTGTYVHICGDECSERGVCVMPKQKEEWICNSCHENIVVFTV